MCGSMNHIFLPYGKNAHAWECYNCMSRYWIDFLAIDSYMMEHEVDHDEATNNMENCDSTVIFIFGRQEHG
jgi:hypothetical protein